MADIKTHLRELSVATMIGVLKSNLTIDVNSLYGSDTFYSVATKVIDSDITAAKNICDVKTYTGELATILDNGFRLGKYIFEHELFTINSSDKLFWLGNDTQKNDLLDVQVGSFGFSLKEESFILENMGLYKYLNLITNSTFSRGLHVFKTFSLNEYNAWFKYTWDYLANNPTWKNDNGRYVSKISSTSSSIILDYNNEDSSTIPCNISTIDEFEAHTSNITREKVFSKWISDVISNNSEYLRLKKLCSETAGYNVCQYISKNNTTKNLNRLLQIYPSEYYYAKSNSSEMNIFKVPSSSDFEQIISISSITYDVPASQLNIITTLHNDVSGKYLHIRNECRFSHGQFNGTPEAKMYYGRNEDLSTIYTPINDLI